MTKSKIFFIISLSFIGGAFAASFFDVENYFLLILVLASIAIFIVNHRSRHAVVASAAILFLALGAWHTSKSLEFSRLKIENDPTGPQNFTAVVSGEPEISEKNQKITVSADFAGYTRKPAYGFSMASNTKKKILINTPLYPEYQYGDELDVSCVLKPAENFSEGFDYQMYLAKGKIYRVCDKANISILRSNGGNVIYAFILTLKNKFEEKLSQIFPDPEGAYLKGLLLGGSKRMPKDFSDAFAKTGTSHTVAVSGYNVTVVAAFLMWLGIYLGLWRQQVFSFAAGGIVFFVLMTGAPASAVRAGIMGTLVIWAMKEGRLANSTNAILLAASAMLAINPLLLRHDAGFQLSFLATLGIVQLSPIFEKFWKGRPPKIVQETVILTMAATIFVLPIILNSFEKLPVVSPFANFLILPAIPYIMGTGFAAGIAGFVFVPLGKLVGFLPYVLLKIELFIVQWMANLPWASIEIKIFGWKYITLYYILLAVILYRAKTKEREKLRRISQEQSELAAYNL